MARYLGPACTKQRVGDGCLHPTVPFAALCWQAWVVEMLFTFGLLFVMHASTPGRFTKDHGGIAVAMLIIGGSFACASISGGIFNPAVALGVCLASHSMDKYWIYLVRTRKRVPAIDIRSRGYGGAAAGLTGACVPPH
jgi:aquaporin Z